MPPWAKSVAVNDDGEAWFFNYPSSELIIRDKIAGFDNLAGFFDVPSADGGRFCYFDTGYDTANWQHSAIDR